MSRARERPARGDASLAQEAPLDGRPGGDGLLVRDRALEVEILRAEDAAVAALGDDTIEQIAATLHERQVPAPHRGIDPSLRKGPLAGVERGGEFLRGARGLIRRALDGRSLRIGERRRSRGLFHGGGSLG
jgi:hypothetical protein